MARANRVSKSAEEVVSMFLGLVIVMVVFGLVINFFRRRKGSVEVPGEEIALDEADSSGAFDSASELGGDKYVVVKGDNLWNIAQRHYNSGYKWVDIAKANELSSPGLLETGQQLVLPSLVEEAVAVETVTTGEAIGGDTYQVIRGDNLWEIAVRSYGDGYAWTKIWQANTDVLNSPNLLENGMSLVIPR